MILQLIVQGDEEVKHLITEFVCLIENQENPVATLKVIHGIRHHVHHGTAGRLDAHSLKQLSQEILSVPILRAGKNQDIAVPVRIGSYGLRLSASGIAGHCHAQVIELRIFHEVIHADISLGLHQHPSVCVISDLCGDSAPHLIRDKFPFAIDDLAEGCRTDAPEGGSSLSLALLVADILLDSVSD